MAYKDNPEMIRSGIFDEKFKNYLRDYYTYGFKNAAYYTEDRSKGTFNTDLERLNNILKEYMDWSEESHNDIIYITQDSQTMSINPFHRVYRFCVHRGKQPAYFLNTMAAFSYPRIELRNDFSSLKGDEDAIRRLQSKMNADDIISKALSKAPNTILKPEIERRIKNLKIDEEGAHKDKEVRDAEKSEIVNYYKRELEEELVDLQYDDIDLFVDILKKTGIREKDIKTYKNLREGKYTLTTSDLACYYQGSFLGNSDRNHTLNNNLLELKELGLISQERTNEKDDNKWALSSLTLDKLILAGSDVNNDFERHFFNFLDFFSKYYIFGELGTFLLDRMDKDDEWKSCFRFQQQYFMQSLNDFNIIDLTAAMEQGLWCCIEYKHATKDIATQLLCYPLEIRVSSVSGREHLMYYDPTLRRYNALRIEFIDSITYYDDADAREVLNEAISRTGEEIDNDLVNVRDSLRHSWGVSTPSQENGKARLTPVKLRIHYDAETEQYILRRLRRECRSGKVDIVSDTELEFTADVTDTVELRPWVRSFYSRIENCDGFEKDGFTVESDIERMADIYSKEKTIAPDNIKEPDRSNKSFNNISDKVIAQLGNGSPAKEHEKLFNKIFSVQYYMLADGFTRLCSTNEELSGDPDDSLTEESKEALIERIKDVLSEEDPLRDMKVEMGDSTENYMPGEIEEFFTDDGFISEVKEEDEGKQYSWEYTFSDEWDAYTLNFYQKIVPLTELEICWLKTILADDHAGYFLQEDEMNAIKGVLDQIAPDIVPLPMDKIVYYDRYHFPEVDIRREKKVIGTLIDSIFSQKKVTIRYRTGKGRKISGGYTPVFLEFSMRNNRFQVYCVSDDSSKVTIFNLSGILDVKITKDTFNPEEAKEIVSADREKSYHSVIIEFYDQKNLADRILTEFSPWRKTCRFNTDTGLYTLEIFYLESDEKELVIRLLGYGADIYVDEDSAIGRDIRERVKKQETIFKGQE